MSTIITRLVKGAALTNDEVDSNFTNLNTDLVSTQANVTAANIQIATVQANVGAFGTYANATFATGSYGNTQVSTYLPVYSGSLSNSSTIRTLDANLGTATTNTTTLFANAAAQANQITGANAACVSANTALKNYVNGQVTATQGQITTANTAMKGYVDGQVATTQGQITTANTAMKGYVDGQVATRTTTGYVDSAVSTAVNNLINSAPGTLDTLGEIAANLASGSSATGAVINSITATNANVTAANARIATLDSNLGSATTDITTLFANAATQSVSIASKAATSSLATVATTGSYTDLTNKPTIPAAYTDSNVATYLPTYTGSLASSSSIVDLYANAATQGSAIAVLTANAGAQATSIAAKADTSSLASVATSGSYNDLSSRPAIPTQYSDTNVAAVLAGSITVGNIASTNGYFWANGTAYSTGSGGGTYGNADVATYLSTGISGNVVVNGGSYLIGDGSKLTGITSGTYGNTQVAAYLPTDTTIINLTANAATQSTAITGITGGTTALANVTSTGGYFWANGTAYSSGGGGAAFTGNLRGSTLSDSTNLRVFVNATGTSAPTVQNYTYTKNITAPNYISGVLNLKPTVTAVSGQTTNVTVTTCQTSSNIPLQSQYGAGGAVTTAYGAMSYVQTYPVTANTMNNNDRVRAHGAVTDVIMTGQTWGSNASTASPIGGMLAVSNATGYGTINAMAGMSSLASIAPTDETQTNNMNVTYLTGYQSYLSLYSGFGVGKSNVAYARGFSPSVTGMNANCIVQNAVGLHTPSGWAGSGAASSSTAQNRFVILNEDSYTHIQTAGNITTTGNITATGKFATNGDITTTNGNITTAIGNFTTTYGNFTTTYGNITAGSNITATGDVTIGGNLTFTGSGTFLFPSFSVALSGSNPGQPGQMISITNGTAKNAGQMAYWDSTNARWSWVDTNLAVS